MTPKSSNEIDRQRWHTYKNRKNRLTWAVKLPLDSDVPTREGTIEAEAGDYVCIDVNIDGGLYVCDENNFEKFYEPTGFEI